MKQLIKIVNCYQVRFAPGVPGWLNVGCGKRDTVHEHNKEQNI